MAKKAHVLDLVTRARSNGYKRGAHKDRDQIRHRAKHVKKTMKDQDATLKRYVLWHLAEMQEGAATQNLTLPSEDDARAYCLGAGVDAPDLSTIKDFLRFYIATSRPQLSTVPTVDSINTVAEWFFAGFSRITGTETSADDRSEVYDWVRKVLTAEGIVVNKRRPKHNLTEKDVKRIQLAPWIKDDLIFIPERYRVQVLWAVNEFCNSGARLGAFFTKGVQWRDIDLVLQRNSGYIYNLKQRWVKGNRDPENIVFGIAGRSHNKLLHNNVGLLLIMAIADDALVGYKTLQDLQEQEIPTKEDEVILRFKDSMLDKPILRKCTMSGGITDEPMPRDAFIAIFNAMIRSAGYTCAASIHAIRRQLGKKVDERYTEVQRSQHLTQGDVRVFGQSYVANTSSVDGQAAYLGEAADHRHIEFFQGMGKFYEEGLPCRLSAQQEDEVQRDPRLLELEKAARAALSQGAGNAKIAKATLASQRKTLMRIALQQYQEKWIRERRDWKVTTRGKQTSEAPTDDRNNFVHSLFRLFPERDRLAKVMIADQPLKPEEMWRAMDDLLTLCRRDTSILYLPGHQPINGCCPVKCCQLNLESIAKRYRNAHIQDCLRREYASQHEYLQSDVHYCHLCFRWILGSEQWTKHCTSHINDFMIKTCGTVTYCHTLVRPGYCPFCLGDNSLSAARRFDSWTRDLKQWTHVLNHVQKCTWPLTCPHPSCDTILEEEMNLQYHFIDEHGMGRPSKSHNDVPAGLKRKRDAGDDSRDLEWLLVQSPSDTTSTKKARSESSASWSAVSRVNDDGVIILDNDEKSEIPAVVTPHEVELSSDVARLILHSSSCRKFEDDFFPEFLRSPSPAIPDGSEIMSTSEDPNSSACIDADKGAELPKPQLRLVVSSRKPKITLRFSARQTKTPKGRKNSLTKHQ